MGFNDLSSGIATSIYLGLYVCLFAITSLVISKKGWKSTYTTIWVFCLLRTGAEVCGVAFSVVGFDNINLLIGYLVLGAEGYFALVLASFHFLCNAQEDKLGKSFLRPCLTKEERKAMTFGERRRWQWRSPAHLYHYTLIPANAILIAGGTITAGVPASEFATSHIVHTGRIMRCVGQTVFLVLTVLQGGFAIYTYKVLKVRGAMIVAVLIVLPFLIVRGVYGILSAVLDDFNYYDFNNYTAAGLTPAFLVREYVMAVTMEFISACVLLGQYFISRNEKRYDAPEVEMMSGLEKSQDRSGNPPEEQSWSDV
jgi:hypothetical protein